MAYLTFKMILAALVALMVTVSVAVNIARGNIASPVGYGVSALMIGLALFMAREAWRELREELRK